MSALALHPLIAQAQTQPTAQPSDSGDPLTRTAARDLAAQGSDAFEHQQYEQALDLFRRAGALVQAPTITLMEARSLRELGRWLEALDAYEATRHMPLPSDANPAFNAAIATASSEETELRSNLPRLNLQIGGLLSNEHAELFVDGHLLPDALIGVDTPFDPGPHRVELRVEGRAPLIRELTLQAGARQALLLEPEAPAPKPVSVEVVPPRASAPLPPPTPASSKYTSNPLGWVGVGVGAASIATGIVFGALALDRRSELNGVCHRGACPMSYKSVLDDFRNYRTVSFLTIGLGSAVMAGSGAWLLFSRKTENERVALSVSPNGVMVEGEF